MPEMRRTTLRMPEHFHSLLEHEAAEAGLSVAGLIREAAFARVLWGRATRGESIYGTAAQVAHALQSGAETPQEPSTQAIDDVVVSVLENGARELNGLLRVLDKRDPERGSLLRQFYGLAPGQFAPMGDHRAGTKPAKRH